MDNLKCMPLALFVLVYVWNSYAIIEDAGLRNERTRDFTLIGPVSLARENEAGDNWGHAGSPYSPC